MKNILFASFVFISLFQVLASQESQVLVLGTIHQGHAKNPNYSYQDILNIIGSYKPDAICVEIPKEYFRKRAYLQEMTLATFYGIKNNIEVYPIDWFDMASNVRQERAEYIKSDEFKQKEMEERAILEKDETVQAFEHKYGNLEQLFQKNNQSYSFYNGKEYNDYVRRVYEIAISVYGDSCITLYSEKRNQKMFNLIEDAISKNRGKRLIVLTGAEHKYYFDLALANMQDVRLMQLEDVSIKKVKPSKELSKFLNLGVAREYLLDGDATSIDAMYIASTTPLLHGPNMDEKPHIIPKENIKKALLILNEWKKDNADSVLMSFERAWVLFLQKDYKASLKTYLSIADRLDEVPSSIKWFVSAIYNRNLGFVYDMLGRRDEAMACYIEGKKTCEKIGLAEAVVQNMYKNYEIEPYIGK